MHEIAAHVPALLFDLIGVCYFIVTQGSGGGSFGYEGHTKDVVFELFWPQNGNSLYTIPWSEIRHNLYIFHCFCGSLGEGSIKFISRILYVFASRSIPWTC